MTDFRAAIELVGAGLDCIGVLVIVIGVLTAVVQYLIGQTKKAPDAYRLFRQNLGKGILLGLEILVAGDIIRTVGVAPTMQNVLILGLIVVIRTFLSWSLDVELEGTWPWKRKVTAPAD